MPSMRTTAPAGMSGAGHQGVDRDIKIAIPVEGDTVRHHQALHYRLHAHVGEDAEDGADRGALGIIEELGDVETAVRSRSETGDERETDGLRREGGEGTIPVDFDDGGCIFRPEFTEQGNLGTTVVIDDGGWNRLPSFVASIAASAHRASAPPRGAECRR